MLSGFWRSVSVLCLGACSGVALAQPEAYSKEQYGDRQSGYFGDSGAGYFGNTSKGEFDRYHYSREQEGQVPLLSATPVAPKVTAKPDSKTYVLRDRQGAEQ